MACFPMVYSTGLFAGSGNMVVNVGKRKPCRVFGRPCSNYLSWQSLHVWHLKNKFECSPQGKGKFTLLMVSCRKSGDQILTTTGAETKIDGNNRNRKTTFWGVKGGKFRKRFSLRLRPRLRLLSARMKRVTIRSIRESISTFLRKHFKRLSFLALVAIALGSFELFLSSAPSPKIVPYSALISNLQNGFVRTVKIEEGSPIIYFNVNSPQDKRVCAHGSVSADATSEKEANGVSSDDVWDTSGLEIPGMDTLEKMRKARGAIPKWEYSTRKIDHDEKYLIRLMREKGVTYASAPPSVLMLLRKVLLTFLALWVPFIPIMWFFHRQLSFGNSPARKKKPPSQMVGFDDVQGVDAAKLELMEIVSCLKGSLAYQKLGAKLPRGILLVGPPGTGKTLLARAVAGEAGVPFFTVSASEFVELFVGRGAARIRDLFSSARKSAPSIIFIDELDAVGCKRGRTSNDERDQTLNQLLTEMDGFESEMKVVVVAATNRPEALDAALCRPGRFSRKVVVGEPDEEGRKNILAVHLREVPLEEDSDIICHLVASLTPGFVGADLANIVNEAALLAARRGGEAVAREDIMAAVERAKFGINDKQLRPATLSKELGKLFPWIPSLRGTDSSIPYGWQGPKLDFQV